MTFHIILCDDQEIVCEGLQKILESDPEIKVTGIASNGQEAVELVKKNPPDLVLMDLKMPVMNGMTATRKIRELFPQTRVLVLTTYDDDEWLFEAIRSGASGYLLKDTPRSGLIEAIKGTILGNSYVDPSITGKLLNSLARTTPPVQKPNESRLSERELDVLKLIVRGLTNADIAQRLFLSEGTVRNYSSAIFDKLGVSDRTQAVVAALRQGILSLNDLD